MRGAVEQFEHNKSQLHTHADGFRRVFGISLSRFMHPLFGFDVVRFDEWIGTPDGVSLSGYLTSKYGDAARTLVEELIR